jgi:sigma-B regulation protein RsbU (phosphoserine phosphatase)
MEVTLRLAHQIQMSLLPKILPPFPFSHQLDLYAAIAPAKEVGGDFYDFFLIDDRHLFFAIGDVSGKGVPAALFMAVAKTLLKTSARKGFGPGQMLSEVNTELCLNNDSCMLVTIFCGILNLKTGEVLYASAGHNPPLLVRRGNQVEYVNDGAGLVIGVETLVTYDAQRVTLEPGDFLFLYTDGVTEARNERREFFSENRLKDEVCASKKDSSQQLIEEIMHTIRFFSQGMPQADDITMMNLRLKADFSP